LFRVFSVKIAKPVLYSQTSQIAVHSCFVKSLQEPFPFASSGQPPALSGGKKWRWPVGLACMLASLAVWGAFTLSERSAAHDTAMRSLAAFTTDQDIAEKQAAAEGQTQVQLLQTNTDTRRALLQTALQDPTDAQRLKGREQAFSVSLSQVKSSETRSLFQEAILPAIQNSADPLVLGEAFELMRRWSVAGTMKPSESDSLAGVLVEKMLATEDTDTVNALASGVTMIAAGVSPSAADDLAWKLAIRSTEETRASVSDARLPALLALERTLGTESAGKLASKLIDRMFVEQNGGARRTLAMEARDPDGKVSQAVGGEIADKVADRMIAEVNASSMEAWAAVLDSLKDVIAPAKAGELAIRLAGRVMVELNLAGLESLFSAWRGLAEKATPQEAEQLISSMTRFMGAPFMGPHALNRTASELAALKLAPAAFAPAGTILLARMQTESDPLKLADLGSGVAILREKLPQNEVDEASAILVKRMVAEHDASAIAPMASAVDDLDEGISKAKVVEFAASLAARMRTEKSSNALFNLAIGFIALAQQTDGASSEELAAPLLVRMEGESQAQALRTLAFSLGAVADGVSSARIHAAGTKLATAMAVETDPDSLRALVAGLCAFKDKAGADNLTRAATVLSARIRLEEDPVALRNLVGSLHALGDSIDASSFAGPAVTLVDRMTDTKNPAVVRGLAHSLNGIASNLSGETATQLASKLSARIAMESDPELLRAYGGVLGLLPQGSLSAAELGNLDRLFAIPDAPCQAAARAEAKGDLTHLVREILNPLCSEDGWTQAVAALGDATKQSIFHQADSAIADDSDADFKSLVVADDDDESSAATAAAADTGGSNVDFNKLSQVLEGLRPKQPIPFTRLAAQVASGILFLAGAILLLLSWKYRTRAPRPG
jgi:hypothetical protein